MLTGYYLAKKRLGARDRKFLVGAAVDASLTFLRACIVPTTICVSGIWAGSKKITRYLCTRRRKKRQEADPTSYTRGQITLTTKQNTK